jgi:uncharacterized protein (DUF2147 family)|tara:strand:+ start:3119 stop:3598 length:480 start_codon:yes stop_codon:yes gene_type:complete
MRYVGLILFILFSFSLQSSEKNFTGYWLTPGSIIEIKSCDESICAEITHIFVPEGIDPLSVLDENNSNAELRGRSLVGVNLFQELKKDYILNRTIEGGRVYNPNDGKSYKAKVTLLENNNLKVEGCVLFLCQGEEWQPLLVTINPDGSRQATLKNNPEV